MPPTPEQITAAYERMVARSTRRLVVADLGECLEFGGARNERRGGYAQVRVGGHVCRGHRVAFAAVHGPLHDGNVVRHRCDNPPCIEPAHLLQGTQAENLGDMTERGRSSHGEDRPAAKLSGDQASTIRLLYVSGAADQPTLARQFGVCETAICSIIARRTWRHVA